MAQMRPSTTAFDYGDAGWEARIICLRWLIEFLGITMRGKQPVQAVRKSFDPATNDRDVGIEELDSKALYPTNGPHAVRFAETWQAASKATAHGTADKPHPLLEDAERNKTALAVIEHLTATIYGGSDEWLRLLVFVAGP